MANGPSTRATAKAGPRSNFAEFRRQMKLKAAAPAAVAIDDDVATSPSRQSPRSSMLLVVTYLQPSYHIISGICSAPITKRT